MLKSDYANGVFSLETRLCPIAVSETDDSFVDLTIQRETSFFGEVHVRWQVESGNVVDVSKNFHPFNGTVVFKDSETFKVPFFYLSHVVLKLVFEFFLCHFARLHQNFFTKLYCFLLLHLEYQYSCFERQYSRDKRNVQGFTCIFRLC